MKALIKNKWFWILVAVVIIATFFIARSKAGDSIASTAGMKTIPLGASPTPAATLASTGS